MGTRERVGRGFTEVFNRSFSNYSQEEPGDYGLLQSQSLYFLWEKKGRVRSLVPFFTSYRASWVRIFPWETVSLLWGLETGRRCQLIPGQAQQVQIFAYGDFASTSSTSVTVILLFPKGEHCLFNPPTLRAQPMARYTAELQCLLTEWALTPIKTYPRHSLLA